MRQFQQQQLQQFDALLANYNWSSVFNTSGIDRKVNNFLQITENMIYDYFPKKTVRIYSKHKPFMTSKIKHVILKRNMAFKNKKVELVRSLRKRITSEMQRPIAFVIKINMLPSVIERVVAQGVNDDVVVDENTILFMHDTTS